MVKEELIAGLKIATSRGESIEKATQSLVNAGYDIQEIQAAAQEINMGLTPVIPQPSKTFGESNLPQQETPKQKKNISRIILICILLALLLFGIIGLIMFII